MRIKNLICLLIVLVSFSTVHAQFELLNEELQKLLALTNKLETVLSAAKPGPLPVPIPVPVPVPAPALPPVVEKVIKEKLPPQKIEEFREVVAKEKLGQWFDNLNEEHVTYIAEKFNKTTPGSLAGLVEIAQPQLARELPSVKLEKVEQAVAQDPELVAILSKLTPDQISKFIDTYKKTSGTMGNIARALVPDLETKLTAAELKKIETVLSQRPDLIEVLANLSETQLNQLIDAVKNNQNVDEMLEKIKGEQEKAEEESGEVPPPPPPPWEGGDVPPPPPPPGPAPAPQPPKKTGLTAEELAALKPEEKNRSDSMLLDLINKFGYVHSRDISGYRKTINDELKKIGANKGTGLFKFRDDNLPTALEQATKKFIDDRIVVEGEKPEETIERMKKLTQDAALINEFITIFKPWVLGDFAEFAKNARPWVIGMLINFGAAARKDPSVKLIDLSAIDRNSNQAQKSDEQFVMVFEQAPTYDMLINQLNQLRLDLEYLKVDALEEDFIKKQRGKAGDAEAQEDVKKALERQIRERAGQQEGGQKVGGSSTIFDALEQSDNSASLMSKTDWNRYLFAIVNFDQEAQKTVQKFIAQIKEKKKNEPIKPDMPQKTFAQYVEMMANQAKSLKEFFDAIRTIIKDDVPVNEGKTLTLVQDGLIRKMTYITFKAEDMKKFIAALPDLKRTTLAMNAEQRLVSGVITQMAILFPPGLSAGAQEKINKIAASSKGYADIGQSFVTFFATVVNAQNLPRAEKIEKIAEWYQDLEKKAQEQKDFASQLNDVMAILINVERTPKKVQTSIEPFITRVDTDVKSRLFGTLTALILPYGSLTGLIRYFNNKLLVTTNEKEIIRLLGEFKEALQELNDKNAISNVDLARAIALGVNASESYKGDLTLLLKALNDGNVEHFVTLLKDSFYDAGTKVAQLVGKDAALVPFNQALEIAHSLLAKMLYPTIKQDLEGIRAGTIKIPGLIAKDRASQKNYRFAYEQYNKFIVGFLAYINKLNVTQLSEKLTNEVVTNFEQFGKEWIDNTTKAMSEAKIEPPIIEDVIKKIGDFINSIKDRYTNLIKK